MSLKLQINSEVYLQSLRPEDADALFALTDRNRLYLREWLPWLDRTQEVADSASFIAFCQKEAREGVGETFGIWEKGNLVGVCGLQKLSKVNLSANIGYWISQDRAGEGLARLATSCLMDYAFTELSLQRIEIRCATENLASQKVAERCGLIFEGIALQCERLYDRFVDHRIYSAIHPVPVDTLPSKRKV